MKRKKRGLKFVMGMVKRLGRLVTKTFNCRFGCRSWFTVFQWQNWVKMFDKHRQYIFIQFWSGLGQKMLQWHFHCKFGHRLWFAVCQWQHQEKFCQNIFRNSREIFQHNFSTTIWKERWYAVLQQKSWPGNVNNDENFAQD